MVALALSVFAATNAAEKQNILQQATAKLKSGEYERAAAMLEAATSRWPGDANIWNLLGIADGELHRDAKARAAFEHGIRIAPEAVSLYENLGLLFYRDGDYKNAEKNLARAVALGSEKPGVRFSLAASRLRTGETRRASAELKALEPQLGDRAVYWDERGRAELQQDPAAAETSFLRALALQPGEAEALNGAASAAERQHNDEKALSYLVKAREAHPDDVHTLAHFGAVCIRRDLGVNAVDALKKAHQLDPASSSILFLLARANISLSNWQTAYRLFDEYSKRAPTYAPAYYAMGWIDTKLNRTDDARKQLRHSLDLDPKLTGARYTLAQVELDEGEPEKARDLLTEVLKEDPQHAKANLAMGGLLLRKGDLAGAGSYLNRAVKADPDLAAAHYKLALLYSRKHETKKAEWERAIARRLNAKAKQVSKTQLKLILPKSATGQ